MVLKESAVRSTVFKITDSDDTLPAVASDGVDATGFTVSCVWGASMALIFRSGVFNTTGADDVFGDTVGSWIDATEVAGGEVSCAGEDSIGSFARSLVLITLGSEDALADTVNGWLDTADVAGVEVSCAGEDSIGSVVRLDFSKATESDDERSTRLGGSLDGILCSGAADTWRFSLAGMVSE